jgi:hypothetical protein
MVFQASFNSFDIYQYHNKNTQKEIKAWSVNKFEIIEGKKLSDQNHMNNNIEN